MPSASNLATSVQPSLARGAPPIAATNEAAAGSPRSPGDISDCDLPAVEHFAYVLLCLFRGPVRREPEVDADDAVVRNNVSGNPATDADRVQALVIAEPVHDRLPRSITAQYIEDPAGRMDRVTAEPGSRAVRALAARDDVGSQGALATALDHSTRRFQQDREVAREQVRSRPAEPQQPVALGLDFLTVVEHVGHVARRRGQLSRQPQLHRNPGLHVAAAASVEQPARQTGRKVRMHRNCIDMTRQHYPLSPAEVCPCHDRIAVSVQR
jgi:hypothetical protein